MLLVLTGDEHFWKNDAQLLFLGEWCNLYSQKSRWKNSTVQIVPYHWDDREKFFQDSKWLLKVYEMAIDEISLALNAHHQKKYPSSVWRLLVGPWVYHFVGVVFDRLRSVQAANLMGGVTNVVLSKGAPPECPVQDSLDLVFYILADRYNHHLYSEIIRRLNVFEYEERAWPTQPIPSPIAPPSILRRLVRGGTGLLVRSLPPSFVRHVFVSSYLPKSELFRLQIRLGQMPCPDILGRESFESKACEETRKNLSSLFSNAFSAIERQEPEYTRLLRELIPSELPRIFLEGFSQLEREVANSFPKKAKTIFTANAHIFNEPFKLWAAKAQQEGAKVVLSQHGGHSGTGKWCLSEHHELAVANRYFSWGWEGSDKVTPLPGGKLRKFRATPKPDGNILMVLNSFSRYFYRPFSIPIAGQTISYIEDQVKFLECLSRECRPLISVRPYPVDYGWNELARIRERTPWVHIAETPPPFAKHLEGSRLFVGTHNTTTYLEALSVNFPSVVFWDERYWELRPEAEPYFQKLVEAEILFFDPVAAARKVSEIYQNPTAWWSTKKVQEARMDFCRRFAASDPNWMEAWAAAFRGLAAN